jgi:hypothetical protein
MKLQRIGAVPILPPSYLYVCLDYTIIYSSLSFITTKDIILFGHAPEPIEEDKTWRLVGGNTNGIKPYGGSADLISVMERFKLLQTGTVAFQETNLEWHNKCYRDEFQKLLVKAFGAARVEHSTTKDKFETSSFKPGGTASAALGKNGASSS